MLKPSATTRARIGAVTLHVAEWGGSGSPILFAHPTGFLGDVWVPIIERIRGLGFTGRIATYDMRGHGLSSKPDSGYEWSAFIDDAVALTRVLGLRDVVGVGHSAGATTLAGAEVAAPGTFRRLVLIDPILAERASGPHAATGDNPMAMRTKSRRLIWPSRDELFRSYRGRPPFDTWTEEALRVYVERGTFERPDGEIELLCPGRIEAQIYRHAGSVDGFAILAGLATPTLLLRGGRSVAFDEARAERAVAVLRRGRLACLADATHFVPMEKPDEVARIVLAELDP